MCTQVHCNIGEYFFKYNNLYPQRMGLTLEQILRWGKDDFEKMFKDSAVQRTGLEKLKQNAKACLAGGCS